MVSLDQLILTKFESYFIISIAYTQNTTTGGNERGCVTTASSYSDCMHNKQTCELCIASDSNGCNAHEFPENRRKCVHCDSLRKTCPTQQNPELVGQYSAYCQNATDSCAIINRGGNNNILQMCASEMDETTKSYCKENQGKCIFCADEQNCNLLNSDGSVPTTAPPNTTVATVDPSNDIDEIITQQPSSNGHQFSVNNNLLAAIFMIISIIMA